MVLGKLTKFEQAVLEAIKKIPRGKVATYREVARAVNSPAATRAIGNALNKNLAAPKIPCHRVIKSDGNIGGYRNGVKRKTELLRSEGVAIKKGKVIEHKYFYKF